MRLMELDPRWVGLSYPAICHKANRWASELPIYCGISFDCPHCRVQRLAVTFSPDVNPENYEISDRPAVPADQLIWKRDSGEAFDNLSLSPSLDFSQSARIGFVGHWHGFIKNGEIT